ncbi:MAG: hypothetical protein H6651_16970 [Ardenticatenales bacterium]|nr:hypothetical protein [Ardenticatenales bacterium]
MNPASPPERITCFNLDGDPVLLLREHIRYRPVAYGLLIHNDAVLLQKHQPSGRWQPLAAELEPGQSLELALQHHVRALLPRPLHIGPLLFADTHYLAETEYTGFQLARHYYLLLPEPDGELDEIPPQVCWQPLSQLSRAQLQCGYDAIILAHQLQERNGNLS